VKAVHFLIIPLSEEVHFQLSK